MVNSAVYEKVTYKQIDDMKHPDHVQYVYWRLLCGRERD